MKTKTSLVLLGALLGLTAAISAFDKPEGKRYAVSFHQTTKVGDIELPPGEYNLVLGTSKVHFVNHDGEALEVSATVQALDTKFNETALISRQVDGGTRLVEVHLGGSNTKVLFP